MMSQYGNAPRGKADRRYNWRGEATEECPQNGCPFIQFSKQITSRSEIRSSSIEIMIGMIKNDVRFDSKSVSEIGEYLEARGRVQPAHNGSASSDMILCRK
jgi:hypothetical protein